ncbi:DUF2083 domain-containing protein [Maribius pontilimi]|uniref:DUF2083 domain-containing protein n=1 Tax=Palleronia pontilimi TaxID=1964209 RepID=A0A934I9E8_9RHOB|nr:helix-turn-helix transcriptional regulator [Palleronia pontilimi]MBJ3762833.1 DUF2083 domain-containing protein [Palleronia pontilimi]
MRGIGGEGARIRALRLQKGLAQAGLARDAGISPSYLNLIEHGRRPIGGKLLGELARALDSDPAVLSQGAEAAQIETLRRAAAASGTGSGPAPELDRIEALGAGFPGWSALIQRQADRIATLERAVASLGERLSHDPLLSASVHDVLSAVTAIRSTSAILVEDPALGAEWQARFHRNLFEDSRRLADSARALARQLEAGADADRGATTPLDEMEAWLQARAFHVAELENAAASDDTVIGLAADLPSGPGRTLLTAHLQQYAADARSLPLDALARQVARHGADPFALAAAMGVEPAPVMRRLAAAPADVAGAEIGLVRCDGAGALTLRRGLRGFGLPRFGSGCALWPLYEALWSRRPLMRRLQQADAARPVRAFAVSETRFPGGPNAPGIVTATMLLVPHGSSADAAAPALPVGQTCRICARTSCPARTEPSILPDAPL